MSDESPPPPLRLKPRVQPGADTPPGSPPPPVSSEPPPSPPASEESPAKLRLKPKLNVTEPASPEPSNATSDTPAPAAADAQPTAPAIRLRPRIAPEPAATSTPPAEPSPIEASPGPSPADPAKFKLKAKPVQPAEASAPPSPPAPPPPPTFAPPPVSTTPPVFPVVAPADAPPPKKAPPPPPVPHVRAPSRTSETELLAGAAAGRTPPASKRKTILLAGAALALAAATAAYFFLMAPPPPLPPAPATKAAPQKLTPSETLNQLATVPAQSINKVKDVIAARRATEQDRVDALVEGADVPEARAIGPRPTPAPAAPITSSSQLAPGVVATTTVDDVAGDANAAFHTWVAGAKISGVFQGTPPRALINGRTVRLGQEVDAALGISFHHLDPDAKTIVFRDRSGALVRRRY